MHKVDCTHQPGGLSPLSAGNPQAAARQMVSACTTVTPRAPRDVGGDLSVLLRDAQLENDRLTRENANLHEALHANGNAAMHTIAESVLPLTAKIEALKSENRILAETLEDTMTAAADLAEKVASLVTRVINLEHALTAEEAAHAMTKKDLKDHHKRLNDIQADLLKSQYTQARDQMASDLQAGVDALRGKLDQYYPQNGALPLALDKRVEGLGKERDMWQRRALQAENANRAESRHSIQDAQRQRAQEITS